MAYMTIQINTNPNGASPEVGPSVGDLSYAIGGGASKPLEVLNNLSNIIDAIKAGVIAADVTVSSSTVAGTVSGQTGGTAAFTINMR